MSAVAALDHRCSILVIDDDAETRELLRVALMAEGYDVATASNGRDALDYLRSHALTCVLLLDLMLPVMDGLHFRTAQLHDRSLAWIPLVVVSGAVDADRQARALGAVRVLRKPLNLDEVRRVLQDIACGQVQPRRKVRDSRHR